MLKNKATVKASEWNKANPERHNEITRQYRIRLKEKVFTHYGGRCACCGENRIEFLTLDHKNGGGNKHRAEISGRNDARFAGHHTYLWIKKNNFPPIFQVLCYNCNMATGVYGVCPHGK